MTAKEDAKPVFDQTIEDGIYCSNSAEGRTSQSTGLSEAFIAQSSFNGNTSDSAREDDAMGCPSDLHCAVAETQQSFQAAATLEEVTDDHQPYSGFSDSPAPAVLPSPELASAVSSRASAFIQFKNEINPDLLFDSLEAVLVLMKKHKDQVDDLIDNIAATYRYVLAKNKRQLVLVDEEIEATEHLLKVLEYLPTRTLRLKPQIPNKFLMVPGSILKVIEAISRTSIIEDTPLDVALEEVEDALNLCYLHNDKLNHSLSSETINDLERIYAVYSDQDITVKNEQGHRCIRIPKLKLKS